MMSSRRMVRSPILEIAPSFCLPPVDFCRGVSPTQAAKSRPLLKAEAGGARAAIAVAVIGPTSWNGHEAPRDFIRPRTARDLLVEQRYLLFQPGGGLGEERQDRANLVGKRGRWILQMRDQLLEMAGALRNDEAILGKMTSPIKQDIGRRSGIRRRNGLSGSRDTFRTLRGSLGERCHHRMTVAICLRVQNGVCSDRPHKESLCAPSPPIL